MNPLSEKAQAGIWIINADGRTVYANDRMAEILGASVSEMIGQPSFTYVFPEDVAAAQRLFDFKKRGDSSPFRFLMAAPPQKGCAISTRNA